MIVKISQLVLTPILGYYQYEKHVPRKVIVDIELEIKQEKSIFTDQLQDTIDYEKLTLQIKECIEKKQYNLIEKIVGDIANILKEEEKIYAFKIECTKPLSMPYVSSTSISYEKKNDKIN